MFFSWISAVTIFFLWCCESQSHCPPRMPSNTELFWSLDLPAAQTLIWSYSWMLLPLMSESAHADAFLLEDLSLSFRIFCRCKVRLVDCVGLICSFYHWREEVCSLLSHPAPGFSRGFTSTSACELSTRVCSWGCSGGALGSAPRKFWCGGVNSCLSQGPW